MRLCVIAVGTRMPRWVDEGVTDYTRRMPPGWIIEWRPVKAETRHSGITALQCKAREAQRIRQALPAGARLVLLDEHGQHLTSQALAERLTQWRDDARPVALVIGGPDGIDDSLFQSADERLRLSSMTLPHALVRIVLAEQLYRAWSMIHQHPYHRE